MSSEQERHGPDGPLNDLTGKAIVNDGPNEREDGIEPEAEPTSEADHEQSAESDIEQSSGHSTERDTEPADAEQADTEPASAEAACAEVVCAEPESAEAATAKPEAVEPGTAEPESAELESAAAETAEPVVAETADADAEPADVQPADPGPAPAEFHDFGTDELALRRMLRGAVEELEPSQHALDHLRKAVPARRARRRQAVVGMAAAALFVGMAVPAFVHVANTGSASDARPSIAGHGQDTHGGTGWQKGNEGGKREADRPSDKSTSKTDKEKKKDRAKNPGKGSSDTGSGTGAGTGTGGQAPGSAAASLPTCGAAQLGTEVAAANPADAEGKVYGVFRIANISGTACTMAGGGMVSVQASGAADPARINVVDHTSGDAASGLPDPSLETTGLLLEPGRAYEVRFAWVPTETCPTTGTPPDPSPSPEDPGTGPVTTSGGTGSGESSGSTGTGGEGGTEQTGTQPQLGTEDGGTADGSVTVSHTTAAGAPTAVAVVPNACAGTVYRTGVLAG
ncbi:hypothetical protein [Streptomyces sp. NPDC054887]